MAKRPLHSKIRRFLSRGLYSLLGKIINTKLKNDEIKTDHINRILITRLNHRIGNILFLTPLIKALEKRLPNAKIDLLLGADFSALIGQMPNVNKIYSINARSLKNPLKIYTLIKELNSNNYDLLISPTKSSGSSNISQALIKSEYKLGFREEKKVSFANVVVEFPDNNHEALFPLALMNAFAGEKITPEPYLDISLSDNEKNEGKEILKRLTGEAKFDDKIIIGIFRDARYEKRIADSYWLEYINELIKAGHNYILVDIIAPGSHKITDEIFSISFKNLRQLASFMAALDFFISADTGPMHLASAAKTNVIALFNKTSPDKFGPLGGNDRIIDINNKNIDEVFAETVNIINRTK